MELVCVLLLFPLVLLLLPAVEDANDRGNKEAGANERPSCHKHGLTWGDEQLAHPLIRVLHGIWDHNQLRVWDNLRKTIGERVRIVSFRDANI